MMNATIELIFPPMPIDRIGIGLLRAEREPFSGEIKLPDGKTYEVCNGFIPPTYIRGYLLWHEVDACYGHATIGDQGWLSLCLPPEPVRLRGFRMTALAITSEVTVRIPGLQVGIGTVDFPDCPTSWVSPGKLLAAQVKATGVIQFP